MRSRFPWQVLLRDSSCLRAPGIRIDSACTCGVIRVPLTVELQLEAQTFPFLPISGPQIFLPPTRPGWTSEWLCLLYQVAPFSLGSGRLPALTPLWPSWDPPLSGCEPFSRLGVPPEQRRTFPYLDALPCVLKRSACAQGFLGEKGETQAA